MDGPSNSTRSSRRRSASRSPAPRPTHPSSSPSPPARPRRPPSTQARLQAVRKLSIFLIIFVVLTVAGLAALYRLRTMPLRRGPSFGGLLPPLPFAVPVPALFLLAVMGSLSSCASAPPPPTVSASAWADFDTGGGPLGVVTFLAPPSTAVHRVDHPANFSIPGEECTLATCSIAQAQVLYVPDLAANVFFLAWFALLLLAQTVLAAVYGTRTWGYAVGAVGGMALEVAGYVGRVKMSANPFQQSQFLQYLISLTIGPTFLCGAIYTSYSRLVRVLPSSLAPLSPRKTIVLFVLSDFLSLLLQAGGGAIASIAEDFDTEYIGIHVMLAGLGLQVLSLAVVLALVALALGRFWALRRRRRLNDEPVPAEDIWRGRYFRWFVIALVLATVLVQVRSVFRVAELSGGFKGPLWNNETLFLVLDGAMVALASLFLAVFHPGPAFGLKSVWGRGEKDGGGSPEGV